MFYESPLHAHELRAWLHFRAMLLQYCQGPLRPELKTSFFENSVGGLDNSGEPFPIEHIERCIGRFDRP